MTTKTITDELKLTTLKHLAGGKSLDVVAAIVSLPRETVLDIGSRHGYPDTSKLSWAVDVLVKKLDETATALPERQPERTTRPTAPQTAGAVTSTPTAPAPAQPDEIRALVNTAMQHPSKRIKNAAAKVIDDIDKLRNLIREDEEKHAERRKADAAKAAARAEVERLEQQLAAAKAKLRGDKPAPATKPAAAAAPKGVHPCGNDGCDRVFDTGQGRSLHERMKCEHRTIAEAS